MSRTRRAQTGPGDLARKLVDEALDAVDWVAIVTGIREDVGMIYPQDD